MVVHADDKDERGSVTQSTIVQS